MYFTVDVFNWGNFALKESFGNVWKHNGGGGGIGRHMVRRGGEAGMPLSPLQCGDGPDNEELPSPKGQRC